MSESVVSKPPGEMTAPAACPARRPWHDAPLRLKTAALAVIGVVGGVVVATVEERLGHRVWPLLMGVTFLLGALVLLAQAWVAAPLDDLTDRLERMAQARRARDLKRLPVDRADEVGRIARAVQAIGAEAVRHHHDARQLRRTLDSRVAVQTGQATRQLKQLAMRDPLTELGNRRFLDERLEPLVKVSLASRVELFAALIDVDRFKPINDQLGHAAGDELLRLVADLVRASTRHDDLAVRLGGDEFVVLLPSAAVERVEAFCDALRKLLVQQARAKFPDGPHPSLSIGVAALLADGCVSGRKLLERADERLYRAKEAGRACTVSLGERVVR